MKKIVLLSDGTGNSAAKRHKTNVWRLYQALDLHRDDQIAMYDDGVGSQQFLLFKLLGGAFGWGLKRNVIELYKFLCRNYVAGEGEEQSDRIYLFGFSRGAFTVRVLAGLIDKCGLCTNFTSERELHAAARANYAIYREKYRGLRLARLFPRIRDRALIRDRSCRNDAKPPKIAFIGVWDTVDAYGLPVDELAKLWDRFVFAMRFEDLKLSPQVEKACHALSIDDERHTFHPVLWDESKECKSGRIEQVWFPGVHSDVGGGYPRNDLALVSLDWMISKVEASLVFLTDLRKEYRLRCDWSGLQHDSRSGLRAFYRYEPRDIEKIRKDAGAASDGKGLAKVHRSAFERIRDKVVPYAPTGIPARYEIVKTRGKAPAFEGDDATKDARFEAMNFALDVIYWRRWLYRAFVATTLLLLASPVLVEWEVCSPCEGVACLLDPVCEVAGGVLPDPAVGWFEALCQNPGWLLLLAVLYVSLIALKHVARTKIAERAVAAWSVVKGSRIQPPKWRRTVTSRLRAVSAGALGRAARNVWWWTVFLIVLSVIVAAADRLLFHVRDSAGWLCEPSSAPMLETGHEEIDFGAARPCLRSGVELVAGTTYEFEVTVWSDWMDGDVPAGPSGLVGATPLAMKVATPFRRHLSRPWFELTGRVGQSGGEVFAVGSGTCYTAKSGGPLYLYVNDAVSGLMPGRLWAYPYFWSWGRNSGTATVRVVPVGRSSTCERADQCAGCSSQNSHSSSQAQPEHGHDDTRPSDVAYRGAPLHR